MAGLRRRSGRASADANATTIKPPSRRHRHEKSRSLQQRLLRAFPVSRRTIHATVVLGWTVLTAWLLNYWSSEPVDPHVKRFLSHICPQASCHEGLQPTHRTQFATMDLKAKTRVSKIPRHLLIMDIDALRDDAIAQHIRSLKIEDSPTPPLDSAAYLALYLARLQHNASSLDPILQDYLTILPTHDDYVTFHPLFWSRDELEQHLGTHSATYQTIRNVQTMVTSEYQCLVAASSDLDVSLADYQTARLNVMTRSFGTGPWNTTTTTPEWQAELEQTLGVDLSQGSHAMVPILDLYQHHAQPNVGFSYELDQEAFVVRTVMHVTAGTELRDSYGRHSDSHLLAKYGFVNGDGSDLTQASLALWHLPRDTTIVPFMNQQQEQHQQRTDMLRYLQYDNGYAECVDATQTDAWELKILKYQHLMHYANQAHRWTLLLGPRNPNARPSGKGSPAVLDAPPPVVQKSQVQFLKSSFPNVLGTCRLLSLTHDDYDGTATQRLREQLHNESFVLPFDDNESALEFRSLLCVARLAQTAMARFDRTAEEQWQVAAQANREAFGSRNWTVTHTILGEQQTLEAAKGVALASLKPYESFMNRPEPEFTMRNEPCPVRALQDLLSHVYPESASP